MILYWDEFKEYNKHAASLLSKLNKDEQYVHEMDASRIKQYLGMYGRNGVDSRKTSIMKYLRWLSDNYGINTSDLHYNVKKILDIDYEDVHFYSFEDMFNGVDNAIEQAYITCEANGSTKDFEGLKAFFLLQWYGVTIKEFVSIRLNDVDDTRIHIPLTNREIVIDEETADTINEYKNKQGVNYSHKNGNRIKNYKQNTLYRSIRDIEINEKTVNRARARFKKYCEDIRLTKNNILDSGRYYKLVEMEQKLGRDIAISDADIIHQICFNDISNVYAYLYHFNAYKQSREKWLTLRNSEVL